VKKKQFKFVYSISKNESPDSFHIQANNITNARKEWELSKDKDDTLLAIFCDGKEVWKNKTDTTNYDLSKI
jgi:hypothetical protein